VKLLLLGMKFWSKINPHLARAGLVVAVLLVMTVPFLASAQIDPLQELNATAGVAGLAGGETDLAIIAGKIVSIVIGFLGVIAVIIILIGGFKWMTSGGDSEKIKSARQLMTNGIIGLVIIVLAYAIASFVIDKLQIITSSSGGGNQP